jgi:hypothetical protein
MPVRSRIVFVVLALMLGICAGYAQTDELQKEAQSLDKIASKLGNEKTIQALSQQWGISVDILSKQQQDTKFGFGQLFIANALANSLKSSDSATAVTFDTLAQEFQGGKGWGEIAKEHGLKLGLVVSQIKRSNKAMQKKPRNDTSTAEAHKSAGSGSKDKPARTRQSRSPRTNNAMHGHR